jgi:hypothetical protein
MSVSLSLIVGGALIVRHAWRWALRPVRSGRPDYAILLRGSRPVAFPFGHYPALRVASWAAWAFGRPCAVLILCGPDDDDATGQRHCFGLIYSPSGEFIGRRKLRPVR